MLERIQHGAVLELQLDRPPVNALDPTLVEALLAALAEAPRSGARALVLSGRPGMFSAGLDVPVLLALDRPAMRRFWERFFLLTRTLAESPLPIAAAITGHSPAGGAVLAIFCEHRVAAEGDFKIGLNEVQVGLPVPPVVLHAFVRLVGARAAAHYTVQGALIPPAEALRIGLVDELAPPGEVVPRALAWAQRVAALPQHAMLATRGFVRADLIEASRDLETVSAEDLTEVWFSAEAQAALRAMVERVKKR